MILSKYDKKKDSGYQWLGNIPREWILLPLFSILKQQKIKNIENREQNVLSLSYGRIVNRDVTNNYGLLPESFETYQIVQPGNIILRLTDLQNDKVSLRVGLAIQQGIITSAYVCLSPDTKIDARYAYYLLHAYDISKIFYSLGGGVRQSMKYEDLKWIPILVPPPMEQEYIINFLDRETIRIDSLIEKKKRQIELLQEKRSALISHAVTKGLNPDVKMKDSGIDWLGEIPHHWDAIRFKFVLSEPLKYGANESAEFDEPTWPRYVRITDINDNGTLREETFKSLPEDIARSYLLEEGDLLFARSGATVGKTFLYQESWGRAAYAGYLIRARLDQSSMLPAFAASFCRSFNYWDWLRSNFIQATIQNVSAERYANLLVPKPPLDEQRKIIKHLENQTRATDRMIERISRSIEILSEYRSALISAAVTGKIDVRKEVA